ncbi:MAG: SRPBCC family protein [Actinomycetota bacterium]|nr:SRPBCC family protein [Actinomycetota bacterium]
MAEHEVTRTIPAPPEAVFAVASDVERLPDWLPTARESSEPSPGIVRVEGETGDASYADEGLWRVTPDQRRVEWSQQSRGGQPATYSGWLQVHDYGEGQSDVTVHLSFLDDAGAPAQPESRSEQGADAGLAQALEALERLVTGEG